MISTSLSNILQVLADIPANDQLINEYRSNNLGLLERSIQFVSTDNRVVPTEKDSLFIALPSSRFTPEELVAKSLDTEYSFILCSVLNPEFYASLTSEKQARLLQVQDSEAALQALGAYNRSQSKALVIAITGSSGKTSLKNIVFQVFHKFYSSFTDQTVNPENPYDSTYVLATKKNLNNHLGVPMTLLELTAKHRVLIIEHGANHPGEIVFTTEMSRPDIAIINNVQAAHTEGFGSLLGVALAKVEIFKNLPSDGIKLVNLDSYTCDEMFARYQQQELLLFSSQSRSAEYFFDKDLIEATHKDLTFILSTPPVEVSPKIVNTIGLAEFAKSQQGSAFSQLKRITEPSFSNSQPLYLAPHEIRITSNLLGKHNAANLTAAYAICQQCGIPDYIFKQAVENIQAETSRAYNIEVNERLILIDDSYNANTGSVQASLDTLLLYKDFQKIFVFGEVKELQEIDSLSLADTIFSKYGTEIKIIADHVIPNLNLDQQDISQSSFTAKKFVNPHTGLEQELYIRDYDLNRFRIETMSYLYPILEQVIVNPQAEPLVIGFKGSNSAKVKFLIKDCIESIKEIYAHHGLDLPQDLI